MTDKAFIDNFMAEIRRLDNPYHRRPIMTPDEIHTERRVNEVRLDERRRCREAVAGVCKPKMAFSPDIQSALRAIDENCGGYTTPEARTAKETPCAPEWMERIAAACEAYHAAHPTHNAPGDWPTVSEKIDQILRAAFPDLAPPTETQK